MTKRLAPTALAAATVLLLAAGTASAAEAVVRLVGGPRKNTYSGGPGNDTIKARNSKKETVNCGGGRRDKAIVDRNDRVRRCERVRRPK